MPKLITLEDGSVRWDYDLPAEVDLDGMALADLREYAAANGIDLEGATKKAAVLAIVKKEI